jgi:CubicO group peptidase (beta-lactamase class C family)
MKPFGHTALTPFNLALAVASVVFGTTAFAAAADTDQRIEHIENGLLPAVLVKGEAVPSVHLLARMRELHVPGVSIALIHHGKLEWARGFGVTRVGGPAVTAETLFQAASISKPVSTLAVLHLSQAGKLDLDADVNQYLKTWKVPDNEFTREAKVTLRGLLTHSAGITVHGFAGYDAGAPLPSLVQILNGESPANNRPIRVDMTPGKTWRYSGGGYVIAQQVLIDATGIAFPKLMHDLVLGPLGMKRSAYEEPLPKELLTQAATPYRADGTPVPGGPHVYPELAPAALWTTPSDLARYAVGVQKAFAGTSERVISVGSAHAMLTPVYNQQALGLVVGGSTARKYFNHGGSNEGYQSYLVAYEDGDGAVIMTNSDNGHALIPEILRAIAREYGWPDFAPPERTLTAVSPESFDRYVGAYAFASGVTLAFWRDGSHLESRIWGQPVVEIFPTSDQEYFTKVVDARWVFSGGANDTESVATLHQNGHEQVVKKLSDSEGRVALDASIETERRFKQQTAASGSGNALRRLIAGLANGAPNYGEMSPAFAQVTRQELTELQQSLVRLGPVQAISFKGVNPAGGDIYSVTFERGAREFRILLEPDGRIHAAEFAP